MAKCSWLAFFNAPIIGSPSKKLDNTVPANIDNMQESQQAIGCLRENGRLAVD